ncbi:MAG: hypothetical protein SFU53_15465 [Terrimicrobiaceae bacterium]|nr:hypothetical protein [Terrimicrobiaceae bacterium]
MIAIVFALEFEAAEFTADPQRRMRVEVWPLGVTGHRSAHALERRLEIGAPELIVSAGFAGALQANVPVGTIVVGANFTDAGILDALRECPDLLAGDLVTVTSILSSAEAKRRLGEETGALAADMETAHLHDIAKREGIPFLSLRGISDSMEQDLPVPGPVLLNPATSRPDPGALFAHLFRNPKASLGFKKLLSDARLARRQLSEALDRILPILLRRRWPVAR